MTSALPLKCSCGTIRGTVEPASASVGRRVVCMCVDCQTFARWLGNEDNILDDVGGTDLYQTTPARVRLTEGRDQIRCARLSPKGNLRFFAGCCRTPIANCASAPGIPLANIFSAFSDHDAAGISRDDALGPVTVRIQAKGATGPAPAGSHDTIGKVTLAGMAAGLLWDRIRGQHQPNPFRNDDGSLPREPEIVPRDERARLLALCGPKS
ncbi:MAG: hypothetical protein KUG77_25580 [Nannocystaceae bacterium]|nr:hypothetical protein [Nannocystaceae bacterium]